MKCIECGRGPVEVRRENHRYTECGLENVLLMKIEVRHCEACGESEYVTPDIEGLHTLIANIVASKAEQLLPTEVRFLRKYLGHSQKDFAAKIGVRPETVNRWEREDDPQVMDVPTERFLRLMVFHEKPANHYPRAKLEETALKKPASHKLRIHTSSKGWEAVASQPG